MTYVFNTKLIMQPFKVLRSQYITALGGSYPLESLLFSDPIFNLVADYHWFSYHGVIHPRYTDRSLLHTMAVRRNPYLAGLSIAADLARNEERDEHHDAFPTWNRRRSAYIHGSAGSREEQPLNARALPDWTSPYNLSYDASNYVRSSLVEKADGSGFARCMFFNDLTLFARRLLPRVGQVFYRPNTLNRYTTHTLLNLSVSNTEISYTLGGIVARLYPSSRTMRGEVHVSIRLINEPDEPPHVLVELDGVDRVIGTYNSQLITLIYVKSMASKDLRASLSLELNQYEQEIDRLTRFIRFFRIDNLRPGLYHSQGRALGKVLIDLDRNFENAVEAPEFLSSLTDFVNNSSDQLKTLADSDTSGFNFVKTLAKFLSAPALAWDFGIQPTLQALHELSQPVVQPVKGEGSLVFEFKSVSELPQGLSSLVSDALLASYGTTSLSRGKITFRTEVRTKMSYAAFVSRLYQENWFVKAGLFPTPSGVWDATKLSFVVDWFVPIGQLIDHNFNYFTSWYCPFTMGHSVQFDLDMTDGKSINFFLRSIQDVSPLDPPGESWLNAPGLPTISINLFTQLGLGLFDK